MLFTEVPDRIMPRLSLRTRWGSSAFEDHHRKNRLAVNFIRRARCSNEPFPWPRWKCLTQVDELVRVGQTLSPLLALLVLQGKSRCSFGIVYIQLLCGQYVSRLLLAGVVYPEAYKGSLQIHPIRTSPPDLTANSSNARLHSSRCFPVCRHGISAL